MKPEMPFLAAGAVSIVGGVRRTGGWPSSGGTVILGTVALVIVASATKNSAIAPLVHAFGLLVLLIAVIGTTNAEITSKKKGK